MIHKKGSPILPLMFSDPVFGLGHDQLDKQHSPFTLLLMDGRKRADIGYLPSMVYKPQAVVRL